MASPQLDDGFIRIVNAIIEALARVQISGHAWRLLMVVIRKTYGWGKKCDWISNSQFVALTGMNKQRVSEAMKELRERNILMRSGLSVGLQKDYTQWRDRGKTNELRKSVTVTEKRDSGNSSYGKPENSYGKPCTQKKLIQKTQDSGSPDGSPLVQKRSPRKSGDPRVKDVLDYFFSQCKARRGFEPAINGKKDGAQVKAALKNMDILEIKACIDYFLSSKKATEVGVSLAAALSAHTVNLFRASSMKQGDPGLSSPNARRDPGL